MSSCYHRNVIAPTLILQRRFGIARGLLAAGLMFLVSCALEPPAEPGVWLYVDGARIKLERVAIAQLEAPKLSVALLQSIPLVDRPSQIVVKDKKSSKATVFLMHNPTANIAADKKDPIGREALEKDPESILLQFGDLSPGLNVLRVTGTGAPGFYPFVVEDSFDWSLREGHSYYAAQKFAEAAAAFERAADFRETSESLGWLARSLLDNGEARRALSIAEDAKDLATKAKESLVWTGGMEAEAMMLSGDYRGGLAAFDALRERYPADAELERHLGRLLTGVLPQPEDLLTQIYKAAEQGGNDAVEKFIYDVDMDASGSEARLTQFVRKRNAYGSVTHLQVQKTQRLGRSAVVSYEVRFADGSRFTRKMNFYLNDKGMYKARLD